jgi:hypothetical protein
MIASTATLRSYAARPPRGLRPDVQLVQQRNARRRRLLRTGMSPRWVTVDQSTDTLYVPNGDDGDMSVLNGATCSATAASGCS